MGSVTLGDRGGSGKKRVRGGIGSDRGEVTFIVPDGWKKLRALSSIRDDFICLDRTLKLRLCSIDLFIVRLNYKNTGCQNQILDVECMNLFLYDRAPYSVNSFQRLPLTHGVTHGSRHYQTQRYF